MSFESIRNNPVRIQAIIAAALALVAFYVPGLPVVLILALVAAIFGTGEVVRSKVTPTRQVFIDRRELGSLPFLPQAGE